MGYQVRLAARAQRDLLALFEKLNVEDSIAAALWFQGLEESILSLRRLPLSARRRARLCGTCFVEKSPMFIASSSM